MGWLTHNPDPVYLDRVLREAPRYGVNHLELSHDIVMQVDELLESPERAKLIESVARRSKAQGIASVIWAHEINTRDKNAPLDPESPDGKAFWEARRVAYRRALALCPSVAGVVLMFGSSPSEVWDRPHTPGEGDGWQRRSMPERVRFVVDLVRGVVCEELGKELFVRDFNHSPAQLGWLVEALRDQKKLTVISKAEPQDFQFFYPHSASIGAFGTTPQIIEIDLCGEYWGQSLIPVSLAEYVPYRLRYDLGKGVAGAVGRIDCYQNSTLGTPDELNLFVFEQTLLGQSAPPERLTLAWLTKRYGARAAQPLTAIFQRTYPMAKKLYYTQGFWTWKNQTSVPESGRSIDGGIVGKSNALWDRKQKPLEQRLVHPDRALVEAILREKAEAVRLARENVTALEPLHSALAPRDFADWERRLTLAVEVALVWEAIAAAYWLVKLSANDPSVQARAQQALDTLTPTAAHLAHVSAPYLARQAPRLLALQADLTARFQKLYSKGLSGL